MTAAPAFTVSFGWRNRAACATYPRDLWTEPGDVRLALAFCAGCVVRADCLAEGLDADRATEAWVLERRRPGTFPIFGGFTANERAVWARMFSPAGPSRTAGDDAADSLAAAGTA